MPDYSPARVVVADKDGRHYRCADGEIELFDPGHAPHLAWRMTAVAAI